MNETYCVVLVSVLVGHGAAVGKVLLKDRVDDKLLADGVARELPGELVLPLDLLLFGGCGENLVVVVLDLTVILLDGVDDASHSDGRLRDEPLLEGRNVSGSRDRQLSERASWI